MLRSSSFSPISPAGVLFPRFAQVSWSFYKLTMRDREKSAHDSSDSPDAEEQEQPKDKTTLEMTRRV